MFYHKYTHQKNVDGTTTITLGDGSGTGAGATQLELPTTTSVVAVGVVGTHAGGAIVSTDKVVTSTWSNNTNNLTEFYTSSIQATQTMDI